MNTLIFHKNLVPLTGIKTARAQLNSVSDIDAYISTYFPKLSSAIKRSKSIKCSYVLNKSMPLPKTWITHNKIYDPEAVIYVVPTVTGGNFSEAFGSLTADSVSSFITKAAIGFTINIALSFLIQALMPKAAKSTESADRIENDMFGSIQNTQDSSVAVALNYGMIRIGGQIISSEIETITDQRFPDPTVEGVIEEQNSWQGNDAYGANFSSNLPNDYYGVATDKVPGDFRDVDSGFSYGGTSGNYSGGDRATDNGYT